MIFDTVDNSGYIKTSEFYYISLNVSFLFKHAITIITHIIHGHHSSNEHDYKCTFKHVYKNINTCVL